MKVVFFATLVALVCYVALLDQADAQDATTVKPSPPPKDRICGKGGKGKRPRTARNVVEDNFEKMKESAKQMKDKVKGAVQDGVQSVKTKIKNAKANANASAGSNNSKNNTKVSGSASASTN